MQSNRTECKNEIINCVKPINIPQHINYIFITVCVWVRSRFSVLAASAGHCNAVERINCAFVLLRDHV